MRLFYIFGSSKKKEQLVYLWEAGRGGGWVDIGSRKQEL
jgi:hypothetical protein